MALVFGFAGVRDFDGSLSFDPRLPPHWEELEVPLRFQNRQIRITLRHDRERYRIEEGDPLEVSIRGAQYVLAAGEQLTLPAVAAAPGRAS
jgi:alpha,alpha-trehalose phosphorylase